MSLNSFLVSFTVAGFNKPHKTIQNWPDRENKSIITSICRRKENAASKLVFLKISKKRRWRTSDSRPNNKTSCKTYLSGSSPRNCSQRLINWVWFKRFLSNADPVVMDCRRSSSMIEWLDEDISSAKSQLTHWNILHIELTITPGTVTQYKSLVNNLKPSKFWAELLDAQDWDVYQIEAIKKFYLISRL